MTVLLQISFKTLLILLGCVGHASLAWAAHALALGAAPKYPADFTHFDYVNPSAKVGGELRLASMGTFDKLNPFTLKGIPSAGLDDLVFETLAVSSMDEPASMYGLLAQDMVLAPDGLSITFKLREEARFSDGQAVTAEDVRYSFETLTGKFASPMWRIAFEDVKRVVVVNPLTVRFEFKQANRDLHLVIGTALRVFSKKWGDGKPFDKIVVDEPLASGPYLIEKTDFGRRIVYQRRADYWGWRLPVRKGQFNFDRVSIRYYKDEFSRIEAYKAGEFDFVHENAAKNWARAYVGARFASGELIKRELPNSNAQGMQAFMMNLRRPLFTDVRVRQALGLALDFEWMNRQLFYNQYKRSYSYFTNSELAAHAAPGGVPTPGEEALLAPFKDRLPASVWGPAPMPPKAEGANGLRENLRKARALLADAGWVYREGALRNAQGEAFEIELLLDTRTWERIAAPYARNLERLGITLRYRVTDPSLHKKRVDDYDYDMIVHWYLSSHSPGAELALRFHSKMANLPGQKNLIGVRDPVVDALIERAQALTDRAATVDTLRALDRVLLAGHYLIPHWHNNTHRVSYRREFGIPDTVPLYYHSEDWVLSAWWYQTGVAR